MKRNKKRVKPGLFLKPKKAKRNVEQGSEISLWLTGYNDLFSGFDPRPYLHRALSADFLSETKKSSVDKELGKLDLELLIPANKRNKSQEEVIKRRLKEHFNKHHNILKKETGKIVAQGLILGVIGIILMFTATLVLFTYGEDTLFVSFLIILLEPAGWFIFWKGAEVAFFESRGMKSDLKYYEKMSKCNISFVSY